MSKYALIYGYCFLYLLFKNYFLRMGQADDQFEDTPLDDVVRLCPKQNKRARSVAHLEELLPSMYGGLCSFLGTAYISVA